MRIGFRFLTAATIIVPVAAMAADSVQMVPGRWQETMRLTSMTVEGKTIPLEATKRGNATRFSCISPEMAADPRRHFDEVRPGDECQPLEGGAIANGRLLARARCNLDEKVPFTMTLEGTYARDNYHATINGQGMIGGRAVTVSGTADGTYVGPCTGDEDKD